MSDDARLALLTLTELPRVGERLVARVQELARWKGLPLARVLALPPDVLAREYRLPPPALARLTTGQHDRHCRALLDRLDAAGARLWEPGDADYPAPWRHRAEPPPPVVSALGDLGALRGPAVAILNSRTVTEQVVTATVEIARCAARERCTLVVGGMKVTHRIAAVTVRATGARRVVVLDRGLLAAFGASLDHDPFGFGPGRAPFDTRTTLVLSCFRPADHATPRNGRRRDELIAALADVVVAASARPGGEVERICLRAIDRGQCVLMWQGTNASLVAAGAPAIDEADLREGLRRYLAR